MRTPYTRKNLKEEVDRKALETYLLRQKIAPELHEDIVSILGSSLDMIQANKTLFRSVFLKAWTQARDKAAAMSGIESGSKKIQKALSALWGQARIAAIVDENPDHWEAVMTINGPYFWMIMVASARAYYAIQKARGSDFSNVVAQGMAAVGARSTDFFDTARTEDILPSIDKACRSLVDGKTFELSPVSGVDPMPRTMKIEALGAARPTAMAIARGYTAKFNTTPNFRLTFIFPK